jgi:YebC/PmpR family DNA-binding regulatory protein
MAGHSKWANIKHRKGKADAIKGKLFSRIIKEIISAVKQGGPDPKANTKLRLAIQKAKAANLPNENIERNIKKASSSDQVDYFEMVYELYGYGGVGMIIDIMTDNKHRIASDMRIAVNKRGGTIANPGAVAFNFERKGVIQVSKRTIVEEELFLAVTEAGAEDFELSDDLYFITTTPEMFYSVKERLDQMKIQCEEAEIQWIPKNYVECSPEDRVANLALIEWLEAIDDVSSVSSNMNVL